ncbi:MAG: ABC transporter permease [Candidatus Schekmanbacteria bacterium]|nr:ABC transporter permease [Candidatus Schekmanbacteria bacterium]
MKYLPLILANIVRRNRLRNSLTILVVALAILLISLLIGIQAAFTSASEVSDAARLVTRNKVSLVFPLPLSYGAKISALPGVQTVAGGNWFQGVYMRPENFFARFAVQAERFLAMYPEYRMSAAERDAFLRDRGACAIGKSTADRFGLKVGDQIQLKGDIYPGLWDFTIRAIYTVDQDAYDDTQMFFHWEYLSERIAQDAVGFFMVQVRDPEQAGDIAKTIDALFENATAQTRTETEKAFSLSFATMMGNVQLLLMVIGAAVFLAMSMVAINTTMMSAQERTSELGIQRALGFTAGTVGALVLVESETIALLGAALGFAMTLGLESGLKSALASFAPTFHVPLWAYAMGLLIAIGIGAVSGGVPAVRAARLRPVDALHAL